MTALSIFYYPNVPGYPWLASWLTTWWRIGMYASGLWGGR